MSLQNTMPMQKPIEPLLSRWSQNNITTTPSLVMSDYWFLAGLMLALFFVADPFMIRLDKIAITKHLPLMISLCGVLLTNIGNLIFRTTNHREPLRNWQVLSAGLPLILLGIWIVLGSLYARKHGGINNTFITVGIYMLFTFLAARVVMLSPARAKIVRAYLLTAALFGVFMVLRMAASPGSNEGSFHELEALIIPLAVYFALRPMNSRVWKAFLTLFFLVAGIVVQKNTGFLVLVLVLLYLWIAEWRFRFRESVSFRFWTMLWLIVLLLSGIAAAGYLEHQRGELLPSGNPQYRMKTYEVAINRFYESPGWGTGFTAPATEKFTAYAINSAHGILATHSDILDLAAQGGVIALFLWLWGYMRITVISVRHALRGNRPRDDMHAAAHALACMSLTTVVVYAFNPILLQPDKAFLVWGQFGMLLGVALYLSNKPDNKPGTTVTASVVANSKVATTMMITKKDE
jgi:hypothetical protein